MSSSFCCLSATAEQMGVYQYEVLDTPMGLAPANTYLIHSATNQGDPGTSADSYIVTTMQVGLCVTRASIMFWITGWCPVLL